MKIITLLHAKWAREIFFFASVLTSLLPLFYLDILPSLDGPQHLYTTNIITQLWYGNEFISDYFRLNSIIVGNLTGHLLLSLFQLFLSPAWAEKAFYTIYIFFMAYSFRYLILAFTEKIPFHSVLIVPFSITSLFLLGYYNFSISFGFVFLVLGYWFRHEHSRNLRSGIIMALLFLMLYLSHAFTYLLLLYGLGLLVLSQTLTSIIGKRNLQDEAIEFLKKSGFLIISLLPSLILWVIYIVKTSSTGGGLGIQKYSITKLLEFFLHIRSLIGFHYERESAINFILLAILLFTVIIWLSRLFKRKDSPTLSGAHSGLILFGLYFILYMIFPDQLSSGNITNRISIIMFFMLIFWVSTLRIPPAISLVLAVIIVVLSIQQKRVQYQFQYTLNAKALEILSLDEHIQENSTLLPLNYSENWAELHYGCYLGMDKGVVNLKNPQCMGQFPVVWNYDSIPWNYIWTMEDINSLKSFVPQDKTRRIRPIDYIVIWRADLFKKSEDSAKIMKYINAFYTETATSPSGMAALYKFNSSEKLKKHKREIHQNPDWLESIEQKAKTRDIPLDNMIMIDSYYLIYNQQKD